MAQMNEFFPQTAGRDIEHLRLLTIFHYVLSGITFLCACIPIVHLVIGLVLAFAPHQMDAHGGPPVWFGLLFAGMAAAFILLGWVFAVLFLVAGRFLGHRRHYTFCFVIACFECMFMPFGTVLGIFTILVLLRPSVKELFTPKPTI